MNKKSPPPTTVTVTVTATPAQFASPLWPKRAVGWQRWFPGIETARHYEWAWLRHDLFAGLVLTTVLVPVGIAYAAAAGVPAITGLYATIFGLLAYALFGPSRLLVLGPDSSLLALILGVVLPLSGGDAQRATALAGMMALVSGALCVLAGVARLGFVTELLSKPIRYGYMNGIALTVLVSQLPALFGFTAEGQGVLHASAGFAEGLWSGRTNAAALALGEATLAVILLLKRSQRVPGVLLAVVGAGVVTGLLDAPTRAGVAVLGSLPQGLPGLSFPLIQQTDIVPVLMGGLAVALVSFADTSVLSRTYAARSGAAADPNQEMVALGAANLAAGLFQGIPVSGSASRTPVAEAITSVDVTSADVLDELDTALNQAGITLCFAEMKDPVKDKLKRFGLFARLGEPRFFATLGEAVNRYVESQSVAWVDWEDRRQSHRGRRSR